MDLYQQLIFPYLRRMDAEDVHERTLRALSLAQRMTPFMLKWIAGEWEQRPLQLFGLTFPNILGVAAGFDKDVRVATGLAKLGFGHIEVGTLTPKPQVGNPRPRIFRLPTDEAIINRMGFPNGGVEGAISRLQALRQQSQSFIIGVSLGKQKETPLAEATDDYVAVMQAVYPYADYLAVNISSPNTPGLRELQGGDYLNHMLATLQAENTRLGNGRRQPLLVKIAPDLTWPELDEILQALQDNRVDGIIATNTTIAREGLSDANRGETGGLSGRPLRQHSTAVIRYIHQHTEGKLPIIGVGGVRTADDVRQKLDAGASLVQLYTGMIYEGPAIAGRILRDLAQSSANR